MSGGNHIRAVGHEAASKAQSENGSDAAVDSEGVELSEALEADDTLDLGAYEDDAWVEHHEEETAPRFAWVAPAIAIGAIVGWTAFYGWAMREQLIAAPAVSPGEWTRWIIDWSIPVLLVCVLWLLTMRHSRAEAQRFAKTAALLSQESRELENRLTVVNRELSLAREFLGAQSRDLESLGRIASERISTHADSLQKLIKDNGAQVDAIGSASESALANMTRLRDDLPVVANSARDVTNQVGAAGRTAHEQLDKLVTGFERLNQFGKASENQVTSLGKRVGEILERFQSQLDRIENTAGARLAAIEEQTAAYRGTLEEAENTAQDALRERMALFQTETRAISATLREAEAKAMQELQVSKERFEASIVTAIGLLDEKDAQAITAAQERMANLNTNALKIHEQVLAWDRHFKEQVTQFQEKFATHEAQASEVLAQRLADLDDALAERREAQTAETEKLVAHSAEMGTQLEKLSALIGEIDSHGSATRDGLARGLESLDAELDAKREALRETETQLGELTEAGIRLLEIIQSSARYSREDLPRAIETALGTLGSVEERSQAVSTLMLGTSERADELSNYLIKTQSKITETDNSIGDLHSRLSEQSEEALAKIQGLRSGFAQLAEESEGFAGETQDRIREALNALEQASRSVFDALDTGAREKVDALAHSISAKAVAELERALRNNSAEAVGKLEQAAAHASGVGREATVQLRDQLARVNELTVNLEQRVARARELAEEQIGNDFARRMALITDSLNSSSIDITNALSTEVADTSWDAYLKGDRGIFTRRAVRLIDSGEAREIADLYQRDEAFKANVSRYIHDFEAMLRSVLSTRDGNALGVTILGSDVGKLYVVLAQAIERFRQ